MHKEFKTLLENAQGISEHVIAINLDIRGFSSFCRESQDWDVANYIKLVYSRILEEYFENATYYKATGDGLILIIRCTADNVKKMVNYVVESSLKLVEDFPKICDHDPIINFPTPDKIGIGVARGSVCCITNLDEGKILDYSGRILNLASRLMDMARPKGIVIDQSLGVDLLEDKYKEIFASSKVYVRGIYENEAISVFHTKETSISEEHLHPTVKAKWHTHRQNLDYEHLKGTRAKFIACFLTPEAEDFEQIFMTVRIVELETGKTVCNDYCSKEKIIQVSPRGNKTKVQIERKPILDFINNYNVDNSKKIVIDYCYKIEE